MDKIKYFFKRVLRRWQILAFSLLFIFLGSFLIFEGVDYLNEKFTCEFVTTTQINVDNFFTEDKLNELKNTKEKYKNIDFKTILNEDGLTISQIDEDTYLISSYSRYYKSFLSGTNNSKGFVKAYLDLTVGKDNITYTYEDVIVTIDYLNTYLWSIISSIILLIPLIYILPTFIENKTNAIFLAEPIADFIAVTTTLITFLIVFKKTMKKIEIKEEIKE